MKIIFAKNRRRIGSATAAKSTMSKAKQTLETIQADFDRIALLPAETWNHNQHYHPYLLRQIPAQCSRILGIGCGAGEFSRLLAARCETIVAVDLSAQMIRVARARSESYADIEFVNGDALDFVYDDDRFDCIVSIATLHHLPFETVLRKIKTALKPGGAFVCLDLYQRSGARDWIFDAAALVANGFLATLKTKQPRSATAVRQAYAEHGETDSYLTLPQIRRICARVLPGARVRKHLLWRYSIVWNKKDGGQTNF